MERRFTKIACTDSVRPLHEALGSRRSCARMEHGPGLPDFLGPDDVEFFAQRDGSCIASVSENGWPYVQHIGRPPGFMSQIEEATEPLRRKIRDLEARPNRVEGGEKS